MPARPIQKHSLTVARIAFGRLFQARRKNPCHVRTLDEVTFVGCPRLSSCHLVCSIRIGESRKLPGRSSPVFQDCWGGVETGFALSAAFHRQ
jgi:hypothetical protein